MKRMLDICLSAASLVLLSPLLLACALIVRVTSPGKALFSQARLGRYGQPFRLWKFRTMYIHSVDLRNPDGSAYTGSRDPRVTPAGRWLRASSLDELPQLWNVLTGDMSLVGPRPDLVDQRRFYSQHEMRKLEVRPGLTGLAQISGRNAISWSQRKALDVEYVERHGFWLDLIILFRTFSCIWAQKGVYSDEAVGSSRTHS